MELNLFIIDILSYISPVILLIGCLIAMPILKKYPKSKLVRLFTLLLIFSFLNDISSRISAFYFGSNLIFINSYYFIELLLIFLFINDKDNNYKNPFFRTFLFVVLFNIYEFFTVDFNDFLKFQSYSKSINALFLLIVSISVIIKKIQDEKLLGLHKIIYLLPIYLTINALFGLPLNILVNYNYETIYYIWLINNINSITFYIVLIYTLWKFGKIQKASLLG